MHGTDPSGRAGGFSSELKFVVDDQTGGRIVEWARQRLEPDPNGTGPHGDRYRVTTVYLDTVGRDVFFRRASYGRSKYRLRRYEDSPTVFLERKLRTANRLTKRRTGIDEVTLPLLTGNTLNGDGTAWFRKRVMLRQLGPVCQVSYLRIARTAETADGPVRLTLDVDLTGFASDAYAFEQKPDVSLAAGRAIIELKYRARVPAIFRELVGAFAPSPARWSKYRTAAHALGLVPTAVLDDPPPNV